MVGIHIKEALSPSDLDAFRDLNVHYLSWLNEDLGFQGVDEEMQQLPGSYDRGVGGCILLAYERPVAESLNLDCNGGEGAPCEVQTQDCVGAVALRPLKGKHLDSISEISGVPIDRICEMKRLFVMPQRQRQGIGSVLVEAIQREARALGYSAMVLDTLERLTASNTLYRKAGFQLCDPYNICPLEGPLWFFKML